LARKQRSLVLTEGLDGLLATEPASSRNDQIPRSISVYLNELPEPQRVAIVLRYGLDFSIEDIAEATESAPNTVKYRLKEALAKLRRLIRQDLSIRRGSHDE
jgi:RNA polymerase sigma factor (sigma-70 family)